MVLGRSRVKTPPAFPRALTSQPADWHLSTGHPIYETNVDLSGAFPGYVERGGRLDHVHYKSVVDDVHRLVSIVEDKGSKAVGGFFNLHMSHVLTFRFRLRRAQ